MYDETDPPEEARPTIFLVEEDDDARPHLSRNLRKLGYRLLVAASLEDARDWMSAKGCVHADLVLVDLVNRTPEESVIIGRELCGPARYNGHMPLIVMPERVPEELEGTDVNVSGNDWISYLEDSDQLQRLMERLIPAKAT
ncbi:MAG TPA: hypothetical protein VF735_21190 [Pyrinomonadaceae bacterium]|jgi:DNA-binding response OmpR family regulator